MSQKIDEIIGGSFFSLVRPAQKRKMRKCMCCDTVFESKGKGNAICAKCLYAKSRSNVSRMVL